MHAATKTAEGESSIYPAFLKFALKNVEQQGMPIWSLLRYGYHFSLETKRAYSFLFEYNRISKVRKSLTQSMLMYGRHFGFLPIASVCALNRHQGTTTWQTSFHKSVCVFFKYWLIQFPSFSKNISGCFVLVMKRKPPSCSKFNNTFHFALIAFVLFSAKLNSPSMISKCSLPYVLCQPYSVNASILFVEHEYQQ